MQRQEQCNEYQTSFRNDAPSYRREADGAITSGTQGSNRLELHDHYRCRYDQKQRVGEYLKAEACSLAAECGGESEEHADLRG